MPPDLRQLARWSVPVLAVIIAILSLMPANDEPSGGLAVLRWIAGVVLGDPDAQDKIGHYLAYTALAGSALFGFASRPTLLIASSIVAYSGLFEILQSMIPGRDASLADLLANLLGVLTGWVAASLLSRTPLGAVR